MEFQMGVKLSLGSFDQALDSFDSASKMNLDKGFHLYK